MRSWPGLAELCVFRRGVRGNYSASAPRPGALCRVIAHTLCVVTRTKDDRGPAIQQQQRAGGLAEAPSSPLGPPSWLRNLGSSARVARTPLRKKVLSVVAMHQSMWSSNRSKAPCGQAPGQANLRENHYFTQKKPTQSSRQLGSDVELRPSNNVGVYALSAGWFS